MQKMMTIVIKIFYLNIRSLLDCIPSVNLAPWVIGVYGDVAQLVRAAGGPVRRRFESYHLNHNLMVLNAACHCNVIVMMAGFLLIIKTQSYEFRYMG